MNRTSSSLFTLCLASLIAGGAAGCHSLSLINRDPFKEVAIATPRDPVTEVVVMWESADGNDENGKHARGFNGRVIFFQQDNRRVRPDSKRSPVRIGPEDEFFVYIFDDVGTEAEQTLPLREPYRFTGKDCEDCGFLGITNLGAEYDMFIPYPRPGAYAAKCQLRVKYVPKQGREVFSELSKAELKGISRPVASKPILSPMNPDPGVQLASHEVAANQLAPVNPRQPVTLPSPDSLQLDQEKAALNAHVQEFLKKYRAEQEPEYEPHYEVRKLPPRDPRNTAKIIDLRQNSQLQPVVRKPEAELEPDVSREDSPPARHPLAD